MTGPFSAQANEPSTKAEILWLVLALTVIHFCVFHGLGAAGLIGPDEPRYAAIAREMAESGDWVTPRLHGEPWFEKPPLYYWDAALRYKIWGDTEFAARSASAAAAGATALALGWLASRIYGWGASAIVMLLFPATVAVIGFGRAATTDMLFATALALAMIAAARIVQPERAHSAAVEDAAGSARSKNARWADLVWRCGFGGALGLAALAKGPAALVLAGGSVGLWMLTARRWRDGFALLHPLVIAMFAVVALPWYVLCAARNPEFVDVFLISHNFERFLTPVFRHEQPFWFFGPVVLLGLIPWTPLLAVAASDGVILLRARAWRHSASFFFACWVIFPVVFFSISKSKLPGYVLPVIPAIALLLARALSKRIEAGARNAQWAMTSVAAMLLILAAGALLPSTAEQLPGVEFAALRILALAATLGGAAVLYFTWRKQPWRGVAAAAICVAILAGVISRLLLPAMDPHISARTVARHVMEEQRRTGGDVAVFQLHRAWHYGLNYYLKREVPAWDLSRPAKLVVTNEAGLKELQARGIAGQASARVSRHAIIFTVAGGGNQTITAGEAPRLAPPSPANAEGRN